MGPLQTNVVFFDVDDVAFPCVHVRSAVEFSNGPLVRITTAAIHVTSRK